jgi:hypothetical protein
MIAAQPGDKARPKTQVTAMAMQLHQASMNKLGHIYVATAVYACIAK